jgi:hypothetical protein
VLVKPQRVQVPANVRSKRQDQPVVRFETLCWEGSYFTLVTLVKGPASFALLFADDDPEPIVVAMIAYGGRKQGRQFEEFFEIGLEHFAHLLGFRRGLAALPYG